MCLLHCMDRRSFLAEVSWIDPIQAAATPKKLKQKPPLISAQCGEIRGSLWPNIGVFVSLTCLEHLLDSTQRLPGAFLVLDEREPHMPVAMIPKANAGAHRNLGVEQQLLGELN